MFSQMDLKRIFIPSFHIKDKEKSDCIERAELYTCNDLSEIRKYIWILVENPARWRVGFSTPILGFIHTNKTFYEIISHQNNATVLQKTLFY